MMADSNFKIIEREEQLRPWTIELLAVLRERERTAFVLHESGMTLTEISQQLDISPERSRQLVETAERRLTESARRAVLLHQHVPAVEPHVPPTGCTTSRCKVPATMMASLDLPISALSIGIRAFRCLELDGIEYVGDLVARTDFDLLRLKNMGRKTLKEIKGALSPLGLHLSMDTRDWKRSSG